MSTRTRKNLPGPLPRPKYPPRQHTGDPLRPAPQLPRKKLNDRAVTQLYTLLAQSGILDEVRAMRGTRGRKGFPPEAVLVGLALAQMQTKTVNISTAWEILFFQLRKGSRTLLGIPDVAVKPPRDCSDDEALAHYKRQYATSKRVYRAWQRLVEHYDFAPYDRRRCPTPGEALALRRSWDDPANAPEVERLNRFANKLVQAPIREALNRPGGLGSWPGHTALDDTPIPVVSAPPQYVAGRGSREPLADYYTKGGAVPKNKADRPTAQTDTTTRRGVSQKPRRGKRRHTTKQRDSRIFAHAAMLGFGGHGRGDLTGSYPSGLVTGFAIHKPGTAPGAYAVQVLRYALEAGLAKEMACADRGITQSKAESFDIPLLELGIGVVKHFKVNELDQRDTFRGATLISGDFYCPLMADRYKTASSTLVNSETAEERQHALTLIKERAAYRLPLKENLAKGDQRRQCPALGAHAKCACYRRPEPSPREVDLEQPLPRRYALPLITKPQDDTEDWPDLCTAKSITIPGNFQAKYRQRYPLFEDDWQKAWSGLRSQNEGGNGQLKRSVGAALGNVESRLSPGRVAQTILIAIILMTANARSIEKWARARIINAGRAARPAQKKQPTGIESIPADQLLWVDQTRPQQE